MGSSMNTKRGPGRAAPFHLRDRREPRGGDRSQLVFQADRFYERAPGWALFEIDKHLEIIWIDHNGSQDYRRRDQHTMLD
jgi:hypothetical protein